MAKIHVCDIHKKKEGVLVETSRYMRVKGRSDLRLDFCNDCKDKIPKNMVKYVQLVYSLDGLNLTDKRAKEILERK